VAYDIALLEPIAAVQQLVFSMAVDLGIFACVLQPLNRGFT